MNSKALREIQSSVAAVRLSRSSPRTGRAALFAVMGFAVTRALVVVLEGTDYALPAWADVLTTLAAAVVGFKTARFSTHLERLYVLLAEAEPVEVDAFRRVQQAAEGDWREFQEALRVWIDSERRHLQPHKPGPTSLARAAFVAKSFPAKIGGREF